MIECLWGVEDDDNDDNNDDYNDDNSRGSRRGGRCSLGLVRGQRGWGGITVLMMIMVVDR